VVPLWKGGDDCHVTNAQALCRNCHGLKTTHERLQLNAVLEEKREKALQAARSAPDSCHQKSQQRMLECIASRGQREKVKDCESLLRNNPFLEFASDR